MGVRSPEFAHGSTLILHNTGAGRGLSAVNVSCALDVPGLVKVPENVPACVLHVSAYQRNYAGSRRI